MARREILDRIQKYVDPFRITKGKGFRLGLKMTDELCSNRNRPTGELNDQKPMLLAICRQKRAMPWNGRAHVPSTRSIAAREFSNEI